MTLTTYCFCLGAMLCHNACFLTLQYGRTGAANGTWTVSDMAAIMTLWLGTVQLPVTILTICSTIAPARARSSARVRLLIGCGVKMIGYPGAPHRLAIARDVAIK